MKLSVNLENAVKSRAEHDREFRSRLVQNPKLTIETEFEKKLAGDHEIHVHEHSSKVTHIVLPPLSKYTEAERQEAKTGAGSLEFLRKTLYDPAPPRRCESSNTATSQSSSVSTQTLLEAARQSIRRGLEFLQTAIDGKGAWYCIRFNLADPNIPRHFEKPPFVSALCALALAGSNEPCAKALCAATRAYLVNTMEYPGFWRYYRHLPQDLDSTALGSLLIADHPWIMLGRNIELILANRDEHGRFMTWLLDDDQPDVVSTFRIEADPVVNANVIAQIGDCAETRNAQQWLAQMVEDGLPAAPSKWYQEPASIYYAIARAVMRVSGALDQLRPILGDRIVQLQDESGEFSDVFQAAQAVCALYKIGCIDRIDSKQLLVRIISSQYEDGSWPELLAFGDKSLRFGAFGQIGHASDAITSAFCIEALECLVRNLER